MSADPTTATARRRLLHLAAGVAVAAALLAYVFEGVDWTSLAAALRGARLWPMVLVVIVSLAAYAVRAWRWGLLLQPLSRVGFRDLFSATMVGFAAGLVVPRSGEFVRPWLVARRSSVTMSAGLATVVVERVIDLLTVLVLLAAYLLVAAPAGDAGGGSLGASLRVGGATAAAVAAMLTALLFALHANAGGVIRWSALVLRWAPERITAAVGRLLRRFADGLAVLNAPATHWGAIGLQSLALWLLSALAFHLVQVAFGIDLPWTSALLLLVFVTIGESIPTPGLVGGFHAFYVLALTQVYGVDPTSAAAASIAAHALTNVPVLLIGVALAGREGLSMRRLAGRAG